jgi:predicted PurR-regulated permease PerM
MSVALLSVLFVPLSLAVGSIVTNRDTIAEFVRSLGAFKMPPPPAWLGALPAVGQEITLAWQRAAAVGAEDLAVRAAAYADDAVRWLAAEIGSLGVLVLQFVFIVVLSAILYARGEHTAASLVRFARRLAGANGENAVYLAGQAIRSVALGVVVTALVQSVLGGIGLAVAGVPFSMALTAVMFVLGLAQLGPILVLGPAVGWLYWSGNSSWGTILLLWTIPVAVMDNFLRPALIKRGADLPFVLIFAGVVGGLIAFGLIGIFVGPVVLAVAQTLLDAWVRREDTGAEPTA